MPLKNPDAFSFLRQILAGKCKSDLSWLHRQRSAWLTGAVTLGYKEDAGLWLSGGPLRVLNASELLTAGPEGVPWADIATCPRGSLLPGV